MQVAPGAVEQCGRPRVTLYRQPSFEGFDRLAGSTAGYQSARNLEWVGEITYGLRFRKYTMHGAYATTGIRVLFD